MSFKPMVTALAALVWLSVPGMAQTTAPEQPATTEPTTTDTAVQATEDDNTDFGWIGLLGLLGLAGLTRRREPVITTRTGSAVDSDTKQRPYRS